MSDRQTVHVVFRPNLLEARRFTVAGDQRAPDGHRHEYDRRTLACGHGKCRATALIRIERRDLMKKARLRMLDEALKMAKERIEVDRARFWKIEDDDAPYHLLAVDRMRSHG